MKPVRLLVMGALRRRGRAHGYQIDVDLESWGAHEWSTATSGSVYHALESMSGQGLIEDTELDSWGPVGEVISLWPTTADTDAQWTRRLIHLQEEGAFSMADEPGSPTRRPTQPAE
ncbi:hypothetical protein [Nocardia sp. A7]|uniref:hypothetical protein n=1 Tax=Nocardia sp. A7 TaxID=2789274 RepID=UPI00397D9B6C